jgi:hypothetical protein
MGRCERVCFGCSQAWTEYDEHLTCVECYNQYFEDCGCHRDLTCFAGVGLVCNKCNNYNSAPDATDEDLLDFLLKKYNLSRHDVYQEWAAKQPTRVLPCFRCKNKQCTLTHERTVIFTEEEEEENSEIPDGFETFGLCCNCVEAKDKCNGCMQNKRQKV